MKLALQITMEGLLRALETRKHDLKDKLDAGGKKPRRNRSASNRPGPETRPAR